jgi:AraC-like DNA-binding protein
MGSRLKVFPATTARTVAQNIGVLTLPKAVGLDMGGDLALWAGVQGNIARLNLRQGFDVTIYQVATTELLKQTTQSEPCIAVDIILQGAGSGTIENCSSTDSSGTQVVVPYVAGTTYVCAMQQTLSGCMQIPKDTMFRGIDIRLSCDFLQQQPNLPSPADLDANHAWHCSSGTGYWLGKATSSLKVVQKCQFLLAEVFRSKPNDLAIEAKVLDILSEVFELMRAASDSNGAKMPRRQQRLVTAACELLLGDLAFGWTIRELARQTGLNEKSLKQGFRVVFGMPIYRFLQRERMRQARTLLVTGKSSVAQASLAVGYANPSYFAYLYKREYGHNPSVTSL